MPPAGIAGASFSGISATRLSVVRTVAATEAAFWSCLLYTSAFGTGTAAVISPIGELKYGDLVMQINKNEIGEISQKLYDELTGIQWGKRDDTFGWIVKVK